MFSYSISGDHMKTRDRRRIGLGLVGLANVLGVSVSRSDAQTSVGLNWFDMSPTLNGQPPIEHASTDKNIWQKWQGGVNVAVANLDGTGNVICAVPGPGNSPELRSFDAFLEIKPGLSATFGDIADKTGVTVAAGSIASDGTQDLIIGQASGGSNLSRGHWIKLNNQSSQWDVSPISFNPGFTTGVNIAVGDVDGDGNADIIVGNGGVGGAGGQGGSATGGARVVNGWDLGHQKGAVTFMPYDKNYNGGIHVALGDVDDDGALDLVTASDPDSTGTSEIAVQLKMKSWVFGGGSGDNPTESVQFKVQNIGSSGQDGVSIAVGDVNGDGKQDIIVGAGAGALPLVQVFSPVEDAEGDVSGFTEIDQFYAFDPTFLGGVNVAVGDLNGDGIDDIVTAPASGVPEPASFGIVIGAAMLSCVRRRRKSG
jgi:hypothetical protein